MYLYLVQHAAALSKEEDASRSLSDKGIKDIRNIASFVKPMNITVDRIFHSGKMRALQTAQALEEQLNIEVGISESDGLSPMDDPEIWLDRIPRANKDIMLVGHLPHLARLASLMLNGEADSNIVNFEMGCIVCLRKSEDANWSIDWIIKPGMVN